METSPTLTSATVLCPAGVIVADDDAMVRSVLRAALEALGLSVFLAADGLEAIHLASRIHAALIILDLKMPRVNGFIACERIRGLPVNAGTPIVILTSAQESAAQAAGLRVGATAFHTKPFRIGPLLRDLLQFLPVDEKTRDRLRRGGERASQIAQCAPMSHGYVSPATRGSDSALDRAKYILDALRD